MALITGASACIGQACARALAGEGAQLVLTARRQERLDALKREADLLGTEAVCVTGYAREGRRRRFEPSSLLADEQPADPEKLPGGSDDFNGCAHGTPPAQQAISKRRI